jgi:hypothetical protein
LAAAAQLDLGNRRLRFDPEFELLLACCGPGKKDRAALMELPLNWERVARSAEFHRLIPAIGAAIPHPAIQQPVRDRARNQAWRAMHLTTELNRIARHLGQHEIEFLAHKGPALAQLLYGDSAMRQFSDLDLLVRPKDVGRARTALVELGYEARLDLSWGQEIAYLRSGYEYVFGLGSERQLAELQWKIVPQFYSIDFSVDELFHRAIEIDLDGIPVRTLGHEDLLLVLCVHAAKHEWSQLGMLRDISTLARFELDWPWIAHEARKLGIVRILQISLWAASELFHIQLLDMLNQDLPFSVDSDLVAQVIQNLQNNQEPETESIRYFRCQLRIRERWSDRVQFLWRLLTTPSVAEWQSIRIPDRLGGLYRVVRIGRLMKRSSRGVTLRTFSRKSRQPARVRDNSNAPAGPTPHAEIQAVKPLPSSTEILLACKSAQ